MKHSKEKDSYVGNATRNSRAGKGRFDLISPIALKRLALVFEDGAKGHGDRNWEQGIPLSRFMDSAMRHLLQYMQGLTDEDHLAQAEWNIHCAIHTEHKAKAGELPETLLDLPRYSKKDVSGDVTVCACDLNKSIPSVVPWVSPAVVESATLDEEWSRQPHKETEDLHTNYE